ncbi:MAG TPA: tetratricopeptide repeat protein [Thermodesulfobacteriota bacterium]|nr:tetratricopeptide repeat protein [Thermodesulfobacteriota bacterium]
MQSKNKVIGIVALAVVVLAGIGGYFMGTRSSTQGPQSVYNNDRGAATTVSTPINHSSIVAALEARLKENPEDMDTLLTLGDTYFDLKMFNEAVDYYKRASKVNPDNIKIYNDIGLSLHYTGNSKEGLEYIDEGIKKNPYNQRIWLTKGFVLAYGQGDLENASVAWEKARAIDPESSVGKAASDYLAQIAKQRP